MRKVCGQRGHHGSQKDNFFREMDSFRRDRISRIVRMIEIFLKFFLKEKILNNRVWEISHKFEYLNGQNRSKLRNLYDL